jgi:hypothetical protein
MKILIKSIVFIALTTLFSCHSLGEDLVELPLITNDIISTAEINLKKGETISIWTKISAKNAFPEYNIKYLIEENKKEFEFDSIGSFDSQKNPIIKASATAEDVTEKTYEEKDTIIHKENFEFELKNKEFVAPKDGKYTFNFKLTSETESLFNSGFSIVLRKQ